MKHILGIDHLGWLVRDLEAVATSFTRLGFTLSPRQTHSPNMGSANHTFVLVDTYVEPDCLHPHHPIQRAVAAARLPSARACTSPSPAQTTRQPPSTSSAP